MEYGIPAKGTSLGPVRSLGARVGERGGAERVNSGVVIIPA